MTNFFGLKKLNQYKTLYWQLTKRDVLSRYRGSFLGIFWTFITPMFMLAVYTFFFTVVFQARWHVETGSKFDFALILFAGMIPFQFFSECVNKAPTLILNNVNYVKKIIFPLQLLPIVQLSSALFHMSINILVLLTLWLLVHGFLPWTIVFFPLVNLSLILFSIGLMWFLASLGVYIRDIIQSISIVTTSLLFLSPVFYSISMIPEPYRTLVSLNPLTFIIEQNRDVLIYGVMPNWQNLLISLIISYSIAWLGYLWFQRTRKGFADVL